MRTRSISKRVRPGRVLLGVVVGLVVVYLVAPVIVVIPESFSSSSLLTFPPSAYSLQWYLTFFKDPFWMQALWLSVRLGLTVAVLATVLGLGVAIALTRRRVRGRSAIRALVLSPLVVPLIVSSVAFFDIEVTLHLTATFWGLVLAHTVIALPYAVIILESGLRTVDPNYEAAATSLGASQWYTIRRVLMPILIPTLLAALLFAFVTSWDEVIIALMLGGGFYQTLPVHMFEFLTTEITPVVAVVSTLLIALLLVAAAFAGLIRWYLRRRGLETGAAGMAVQATQALEFGDVRDLESLTPV
ncbi:MAG: ABC transporter permease [Acidimicrobiales bacterium]